MLMAYGFLRRVFEVFERYETPVDVVTTSEVSVSVTIDDRRAIDGDRGRAASLRRRHRARTRHGDRVRGRRERCGATRASRRRCSARSRACRSRWSRRAARARTSPSCCARPTPPTAMQRLHRRFFEPEADAAPSARRSRPPEAASDAPARSSATDGWGGWSRRSRRLRLRGRRRPRPGLERGRRRASPPSAAAGRRRGDRLLDGRGDARQASRGSRRSACRWWSAPPAGRRARRAARGGRARRASGAVVAANFSLGANVLEALSESGGPAAGGRRGYGAFIHEAHHAAKKDAPSGTALALRRAVERGGFPRPIDMSSTRAGFIPGTHTVGFDGQAETLELVHTVRDRATFAHGALAAARWVRGTQGLVHDAGRAGTRSRAEEETMRTPFTGCGTALVTPFTASGASTRPRCGAWRSGRSRRASTSSCRAARPARRRRSRPPSGGAWSRSWWRRRAGACPCSPAPAATTRAR